MIAYYYYEGDQVKGPVSIRQLKMLHKKGLIDRHTQVCKNGETRWHPCNDVLSMIYISTRKRNKMIILSVSICLCVAGIIAFLILRHKDQQAVEWSNSAEAQKIRKAHQKYNEAQKNLEEYNRRKELREDIKAALQDL